jgi:hypothetical protein
MASPGAWYEQTTLHQDAWRNPHDGRIWITIRGDDGGECGGPNTNVWGLFRVEPDGSLTTVEMRRIDDPINVTTLVDIDGDGTPELLGHSSLGLGIALTDSAGMTIGELDVPFFGCPC